MNVLGRRRGPRPPLPEKWQNLKDKILSLSPEDFPPVPWNLKPHVKITNTESWLEYMLEGVDQGPWGGRHYMGTLEEDVKAMFRVLKEEQDRRLLEAGKREETC